MFFFQDQGKNLILQKSSTTEEFEGRVVLVAKRNLRSIIISVTEIVIQFARSNRYAQFVSFAFRKNRFSIKTKSKQLISKIFFICGQRKFPDQNKRQTEEMPQSRL